MKLDSLAPDPVNAGGLENAVAVQAKSVRTVPVGSDEDEIWAGRLRRGSCNILR
jgi:hypothetical protein